MSSETKERLAIAERVSPVLAAAHMVGEHSDMARDLHYAVMQIARELLILNQQADKIFENLNRDVGFLEESSHPAQNLLVCVRQFHLLTADTIKTALRAFGTKEGLEKILTD